MKKYLIILIGALIFGGCFTQDKVTKKVMEHYPVNDIKVNQNVSFSFFGEVEVSLKGTPGEKLEIYDELPDVGVQPIIVDYYDENGYFTDIVSIEKGANIYLVDATGQKELMITNGTAKLPETTIQSNLNKAIGIINKAAQVVNPVIKVSVRRAMFEDIITDNNTDFDLNDVVIDYRAEIDATGIKGKKYACEARLYYSIAAYGATKSDGLGVKLNIVSSVVESVKVNGNEVPFTADGTDKIVINIVQDISKDFGDVRVNTDYEKSYKKAKDYEVKIKFKDAALEKGSQSSWAATINNYIFDSNNKENEIHVLGYGSVDDNDSTVYSNINGLPWAIILPKNTKYALEKVSISEAYSKFEDFATGNSDDAIVKWYKKPNLEKVYIPQ